MGRSPKQELPNHNFDVFINCPFDDEYKEQFQAIVFAVLFCGFVARCALEVSNTTTPRITKILDIIGECRYGIHDISRTELNRDHLPRFNMPLELGLFLGAQRFGSHEQSEKCCIVLDREDYRYQKFISDIAGQDITSHGGKVEGAVIAVRNWLSSINPNKDKRSFIGGNALLQLFRQFQKDYPRICRELQVKVNEAQFIDYKFIAARWIKDRIKMNKLSRKRTTF